MSVDLSRHWSLLGSLSVRSTSIFSRGRCERVVSELCAPHLSVYIIWCLWCESFYMMSLMWIVLNVLLFDIIILLLFYLSITMSSTRILLLLLSYLDYFSIVDNCTIDFAYIQFCVGNISDVSRFILIFW